MNTRTALRSISAVALAGMTVAGLVACSDSDADNSDNQTTTTASTTTQVAAPSDGVEGHWLGGGEAVHFEGGDRPYLVRNDVAEVLLTSYSVDNARREDGNICFDAEIGYTVASGDFAPSEDPAEERLFIRSASNVMTQADAVVRNVKVGDNPMVNTASGDFYGNEDQEASIDKAFDLDAHTIKLTKCLESKSSNADTADTINVYNYGRYPVKSEVVSNEQVEGWELKL